MPIMGVSELWIVLILVIILFGGKKIPELARSMGKAKLEYKKGMDEAEVAEKEAAVEEAAPKKRKPAAKTTAAGKVEKEASETPE